MPKEQGSIAISVDEMTGIQALERIAPDLPMSQGKPLAMEFEYKRNGTQTLIAGLNIATGKVQAICGETLTEEEVTGIYRLLQPDDGKTLQMDLSGKSPYSMSISPNYARTSALFRLPWLYAASVCKTTNEN